ncbi:unnamed protein product [Arctogadus glacialis]
MPLHNPGMNRVVLFTAWRFDGDGSPPDPPSLTATPSSDQLELPVVSWDSRGKRAERWTAAPIHKQSD